MRILILLLCTVLLPVSWGCAAPQNHSTITWEYKPQVELINEPSLAQIIQQLSEELVSCSGLSQFGLQKDRSPLILVWITPETQNLGEEQTQLNSLINKSLLDSGKVRLVLPRVLSANRSIPSDLVSAAKLKTDSGADFLLQCTFFGSETKGVQYELISLETAEVIYHKAIIINKTKI